MIWVYLAGVTIWAVIILLVKNTLDTAERVKQLQRILYSILNEKEQERKGKTRC